MTSRTHLQRAAIVAATSLIAFSAWAQVAADMTKAEVRKIDKAAQKITLKHETIKNLDMPPMTMVFKVQDAALLDKVKPGDKVLAAIEQREGALIVTALTPAPAP